MESFDFCCSSTYFKLEMGCDLTRAYFWPAVNKRPTCLQPRVLSDLTRRDFFLTRRAKIEKFDVLGEIFQNQTLTRDGWPDLIRAKKMTQVKNFWPGPITTLNSSRYGLLVCMVLNDKKSSR